MKEINDKIYKLEAEISNAKTLEIEKEKEKIKNQAKEKKHAAAKQTVNTTSTSQTTLGGSQNLGINKNERR